MLRKVNRGLVKNEGSLHSPLLSLNSFLANGDLCRLLITLANSLDSDQELDPKPFTILNLLLKGFFEKASIEKSQQMATLKNTQHANS